MARQQVVNEGAKTTIRVFYPNPVKTLPGVIEANPSLDAISREYNVTYLQVLDPIYHELVFVDDHKVRHTIIGLAYHMQETLEDASGVAAVL